MAFSICLLSIYSRFKQQIPKLSRFKFQAQNWVQYEALLSLFNVNVPVAWWLSRVLPNLRLTWEQQLSTVIFTPSNFVFSSDVRVLSFLDITRTSWNNCQPFCGQMSHSCLNVLLFLKTNVRPTVKYLPQYCAKCVFRLWFVLMFLVLFCCF